MKKLEELQNDLNEDLKIVVFEKEDIEQLREFIFLNYNHLTNKEFFILDDFDTSFNNLLNGEGYAIGAINKNNEIVAIEAVDKSLEIYNTYRHIIKKNINKEKIFEIGWSMTRADYTRCKIASYLIKQLEKIMEYDMAIFVSTVHPENIAALKLFLNLGYYGWSFKNAWYNVPRIILVKTQYKDIISLKKNRKEVELEQIEKYFRRGYRLVDYLNGKYIFIK